MPIYDQSYKRWEGQLYPRGTRWLIIAQDSLRRALKGKIIRFCLLLGLIPFLLSVVWIYISVNSEALATYFPMWREAVRQVNIEINAEFYFDFFLWEHWLVGFVILMSGCGLIAEDRKNNALSLYLSKSLSRVDYLFGKGAGVAVPVAFLTLIPAVLLYILHALFRNDWLLLFRDVRLLLAIVLYSLVLIVAGTILILAMSSCTKQGRYAAFGFIGLVFGGYTMQIILRASLSHTPLKSTLGSPNVQFLSLYHDALRIGTTIFNMMQPDNVQRPWALLPGFGWPWAFAGTGLFIGISLWVLHRKIRGMDIVK